MNLNAILGPIATIMLGEDLYNHVISTRISTYIMSKIIMTKVFMASSVIC